MEEWLKPRKPWRTAKPRGIVLYKCNSCGKKRPRTEMLKSKKHSRYICKDGCKS